MATRKKTTEKKAATKKKTTAVAKTAPPGIKALSKTDEKRLAEYGGLMDETPVDQRDLFIPKLLLMQPLSDLVTQGSAKAGEIRGSLDGNLVAADDELVEIILFRTFKTWVVFRDNGTGKPDFLEEVPLVPANAAWARNETVKGDTLVRYEQINYFGLLPSEIEEGVFLPYLLGLRSTSYKTGKQLETQRAKLKDFGLPLPFKTFELSTQFTENEKGKYWIYTAKMGRPTTDQELAAVKHWNDLMKTVNVVVDQGREEEPGAAPTHRPGETKSDDRY